MCRAAICRWNGNCQKKYRRVPLYQGWPNTMRCTYTKWAWPNISWTIRRWRRCCHCMDAQRAASRTDGGWCLPKPHRKRTFLCVAIWCWPLGRRIWPIGLVCPTRIIDLGEARFDAIGRCLEAAAGTRTIKWVCERIMCLLWLSIVFSILYLYYSWRTWRTWRMNIYQYFPIHRFRKVLRAFDDVATVVALTTYNSQCRRTNLHNLNTSVSMLYKLELY